MKSNHVLPACSPREIGGAEALEPAATNISRGESASVPPQSQTSPPHRILVVEDDIFIRQLSTEVLIHSGYEVDAAADGAAAWQALNTDSYDLMITDNNMPKVSGVELLKKLRAARMALPVIMATGALPKEEFTRYPWLQPDATLLKPYTVAEMLRTVKKVLREADSTADGSQLFMNRDMKNNKISQAGEPAGAPLQRPTHSPHRILVVDEDSDLRLLYADALAGPGYHVDGAEDGAAGWEALQANSYNLLITEHDMPKVTGVELVKKLRAAHMALPVVMAAGRLPTHELARNPSLQLAATLLKPFAVDALLDTVKNVLRATDSPPEQIAPPPSWQSQPSAHGLQL
jgi:DNA-binding response OmpR family regulator